MQNQLSASAAAMANRTRVTFGKAYIRDVIAGVQRDYGKQLVHAISLGLGTASRLRKMQPEKLRALLAEKLKAGVQGPTNAKFN